MLTTIYWIISRWNPRSLSCVICSHDLRADYRLRCDMTLSCHSDTFLKAFREHSAKVFIEAFVYLPYNINPTECRYWWKHVPTQLQFWEPFTCHFGGISTDQPRHLDCEVTRCQSQRSQIQNKWGQEEFANSVYGIFSNEKLRTINSAGQQALEDSRFVRLALTREGSFSWTLIYEKRHLPV